MFDPMEYKTFESKISRAISNSKDVYALDRQAKRIMEEVVSSNGYDDGLRILNEARDRLRAEIPQK